MIFVHLSIKTRGKKKQLISHQIKYHSSLHKDLVIWILEAYLLRPILPSHLSPCITHAYFRISLMNYEAKITFTEKIFEIEFLSDT